MSVNDFQVVFTGRLRHGYSRRESIAYLASRFGLDFHQIKRLLASGTSVVKRYEHAADAERLAGAFAEAGWHVEVHGSDQPDGDSGQNASREKNDSKPASAVIGGEKLAASDGSCALQLPAHWQALPGLNQNAVIEAGNVENNEFCVVLWQPVQQFDSPAAMKDYCSAQLQQCAHQIVGGRVVRPAEPLSQGRFDGFVGEISARIDVIPVRYLVACCRSDGRVFTQFFWCEAQAFEEKRSLLLSVLGSFNTARPPAKSAERVGRMSRRKRRMRA
ncbi:hypothetical protein [Microbulbifer elongatus]|uniref:hypothetical protein n=1 Tax=Microbulbifer elongatus TaxID=86173 RepID=UPI001E4890AD|nr:hypothetical protein [Microbulbifer elongatus]